MRLIFLILCLAVASAFGQFPTPSQWRTNTDQVSAFTNVVKVGSNLSFTITSSNVTVNAADSGGMATNAISVAAGLNVVLTTNGLVVTIDGPSTNGFITFLDATRITNHAGVTVNLNAATATRATSATFASTATNVDGGFVSSVGGFQGALNSITVSSAGVPTAHAVKADTFVGDGSAVTALNASELASGTVPTARLGSGVADNTTFLRGDSTWQINSGWTYYTNVIGNETTTGQSLVDITNLVFTAAADSMYEFEALLYVQTSASSAGVQYGIANTGAGSGLTCVYMATGYTNSAGVGPAAIYTVITTNGTTPAFLQGISQTGVVVLKGVFNTQGGTPTIAIRHLKVTSGTSTILKGSNFKVKKVF